MESSRGIDPHLSYTKEQIAKNLILLEEHFKNYQCPVCINKHLLAVEGYAEEGIPMSREDAPLFIEIAGWAKDSRNARQIDALKAIETARAFRERCQAASHDHFHAERAGCQGPECHVRERHEVIA